MIEPGSTIADRNRTPAVSLTGILAGRVIDLAGPLIHSRAEHLTRRLRYFVDLLEMGYNQALDPAALPGCLRTVRIALGIDWPELDTVALWSRRRGDGMLAIPFIEFILGEICADLKALSAEGDFGRELAASMNEESRALLRALGATGTGSGREPALPRLEEVFISPSQAESILGTKGRLRWIVRQCELALAETPAGSPH